MIPRYNRALPFQPERMNRFYVGPWYVDVPLNRIRRNGATVQLEPKIMQVLVRLADRPGEVVRKEELIGAVWSDTFVTDDVLTRSIFELRKVFEDDPRQPQFIETIPRSGYRLVASVSQASTVEEKTHVGRQSSSDAPEEDSRINRRHLRRLAYAAAPLLAVVLAAGLALRFTPHAMSTQPVTIAVLPFANLSGEPSEEYLSDGMTEEVITCLSKLSVDNLHVIARTSAMHFKQSGKGLTEIGRELHTDYVLEGSVRRSGGHVRVTAQLINVRDQTHIWADNYDSDLKDVIAVQEQISEAVARAIRVKLARTASPPATVNPEAYQLYLKGRYFLDRPRPEGLRNALSSFAASVKIDPSFAAAWAGVALSYELLEYTRSMSPHESYPAALAAAVRAVELDPQSAEAHLALAYAHEHYEWNWTEADRELSRAMELDPSYELARQWFSYELLQRGDTEKALLEMRRALALDPVSVRVNLSMAERLERAGKREEAIQQLQEAAGLDPRNPASHYELTELYAKHHDFSNALVQYRRALQLSEAADLVLQLDRLASTVGPEQALQLMQRQQIESDLKRLQERSAKGEYVSPADYAISYARMGEKRAALDWLQRSFAEHASLMLELSNPMFDFVRDTPEFQEIVGRVGLARTLPAGRSGAAS